MCAEGLCYGSSWDWLCVCSGPCEGRKSCSEGAHPAPLWVCVCLCGGIPPPRALCSALCKKWSGLRLMVCQILLRKLRGVCGEGLVGVVHCLPLCAPSSFPRLHLCYLPLCEAECRSKWKSAWARGGRGWRGFGLDARGYRYALGLRRFVRQLWMCCGRALQPQRARAVPGMARGGEGGCERDAGSASSSALCWCASARVGLFFRACACARWSLFFLQWHQPPSAPFLLPPPPLLRSG